MLYLHEVLYLLTHKTKTMLEDDDWVLDDDHSNSQITPKMMTDLNAAAGWMRYLGILGFIICALVLISTFITLFSAFGASNSYRYNSSYFAGLIINLFSMSFFLYLSLLMVQYANRIKKYQQTRKAFDLEEAFEKQKIYWMVAGISMTLVLVISFVFGFIGAVSQ